MPNPHSLLKTGLVPAADEKLQKHQISSKQISEQSAKIITFYDLAGHEKYLKTTVLGIAAGQAGQPSTASLRTKQH